MTTLAFRTKRSVYRLKRADTMGRLSFLIKSLPLRRGKLKLNVLPSRLLYFPLRIVTNPQFLRALKTSVSRLRSAYSLTEGKAFAMWFCIENLGLEETDAFQAASLDGANDKDIDLFWVDEEMEKVTIGQLKFNATGQYRAKKGELLGLIHTTDWLDDAEALKREGRSELANAAIEYVEAVQNGYATEYIYAYCGPAQYLAAFRGFPAIGYKEKGKIFTTYKDQVFPPQTRPEEVVLAWQAR